MSFFMVIVKCTNKSPIKLSLKKIKLLQLPRVHSISVYGIEKI